MKKILLDFLSLEDKVINGGSLYVKTVLNRLLSENVEIVGVCRNVNDINCEIKDIINNRNINIITIKKGWIEEVNAQEFDLFFIGIAQRYNSIDLKSLTCKICIVCHDIVDICLYRAGVSYNYEMHHTIKSQIKKSHPILGCYKIFIKRLLAEKSLLGLVSTKKIIKMLGYNFFSELIQRDNVQVVTASEYSKNSIEFYFDDIANPIKVLYPPVIERNLENSTVSEKVKIIVDGKKYFLVLGANRYNKNFTIFKSQFEKFNKKLNNEFKAVGIGSDNSKDDFLCLIKDVNDLELKYLMENAYCLVYPSLGEGFGLPPVEAMKLGTPVIAAYDTSIPEVLGKDVLYFNPYYREDLYYKELKLVHNYEAYSENAKKIANEIEEKQKEGFESLINYLIS